MEYLDRPFEVVRGSGRRPTPLVYQHIRQWLDKDERFLRLHSQTDIVDIDTQLDQTSNILVSNIIQRVIAQIIGDTDPGFVTIKATDAGALHVSIQDGLATLLTDIVLAAGSNIIGNVGITGTTQTLLSAVINIATAATHDIIAAVSAKKHKICSIFFTVAGEVNVTLRDETGALTGAMDFGGTDEPRGMTHNFGLHPLLCTTNEKFQMTLSAAVQVSGVVTYYDEA